MSDIWGVVGDITQHVFFSPLIYINTHFQCYCNTQTTVTAKSKNMQSSDHLGIAAVSTDHFFHLKHPYVKCFSAQQRIQNYENRDSFAFPTKCWLCKAWVRMTGGGENISSQYYPVSQSGVIISRLMAKWCSSCQQHGEKWLLVKHYILALF